MLTPTAGEDARLELESRLSELALELQHQGDSQQVLTSVVHAAIELIPGVEDASISVVLGRRNAGSRAPSGALPALVDQVQNDLGEGPCLSAVYEEKTVLIADMSAETRWPSFAPRALAAGAAAMLAFQLSVRDDNLGALNLYARAAGAFTDESIQIGQLVATHASVAFAEIQETEQLREAVATRDLIGQAKGILMERYKLGSQDAFLLLSRASQETNTKLRDIAERLVHSGELRGGHG